MLSPAECTKLAAKCEGLARDAPSPERRDEMLALARKWLELARGTEHVDAMPRDGRPNRSA